MRLVVAVVFVLIFPGTAAAATWSSPDRLSSSHSFVDSTSLVFSGSGRALGAWAFQDGEGNRARSGFSEATRAPGAAAFGPGRALTPAVRITRPGETVRGVGAYGRRSALVALTKPVGGVITPRVRLSVRFGHTDGTFGKRITIRGPGPDARHASSIARVSLAVNAEGDAALAWFEDRGVRTDRVYVALRRAGHAFGKPRRLATDRVRNVAAAIGASGDVLVAWDARGVLRTRFKGRTNKSFHSTDTIRSEDAFFADLHPAVTLNGRAVLAWSAQFASEGGDRGPVFFEAAVRVAHGTRFRRAQVLERIDPPQGGERTIDAADDGFGNVIIAWTGANRNVRAARVGQSGSVGPAQDLGTGALSDVAGRQGSAIAVWDDGVETAHSVIHAAVATTGMLFGAAEAVTPASGDARFGSAAFDPRSHRPTIVFSDRPTGSDHPFDEIRTFASASTRSP